MTHHLELLTERRARLQLAAKLRRTPPSRLDVAEPRSATVKYQSGLLAALRPVHLEIARQVHPLILQAAGVRQDVTIGEVLGQLALILGEARPVLRTVILAAEHAIQVHNQREIERIFGIAFPELEGTRRAFVAQNVALIESVLDDTVRRVERTVSETLAVPERLRRLVEGATSRGLRVEEVSQMLQEDFGYAEHRANLIARDQTLKHNADLTQSRHVELGVERYTWIAVGGSSGDGRTRDRHKELHGQVFKYGEPPVVDFKTGRREPPGRDFQCRCTARPEIPQSLLVPS